MSIALYVRMQGARASLRHELDERYSMAEVDEAISTAVRRKTDAVLVLADSEPLTLEFGRGGYSILTWGPAERLDELSRRRRL